MPSRMRVWVRRCRWRERWRDVAKKMVQRPGPELPSAPPLRGRHRGNSLGRLKLPASMETTREVAGLYPFLADEGLGVPGLYIGRSVSSGTPWQFDMFELYRANIVENPNMIVFGQVGRRKSSLVKTMATRGAAFGYQIAVRVDRKGEYPRMARLLGHEPIRVGRGRATRLDPLDTPPRPVGISDVDWARELMRMRSTLLSSMLATMMERTLTPDEYTAIDVAIDRVTGASSGADVNRLRTPLIGDVYQAMADPRPSDVEERGLPLTAAELRESSRDATLTLHRLAGERGALSGMFDGPTSFPVDHGAPITVINLQDVVGDDMAIALIMTCTQAWMEAALTRKTGRRILIYDECWRLMRYAKLVYRLSAQQKMSREWGIWNVLVTHRISDLLSAGAEAVEVARGLLADTDVRVFYGHAPDQVPATMEACDLTDSQAAILPSLPAGDALWRVKHRGFLVRHHVDPVYELDMVTNAEAMGRREPEMVPVPASVDVDLRKTDKELA